MTGATSPELAYLDFYWRYDISLVIQDIRDIRALFQRRDSLYRLLGVPSVFVAGRSAAECGPDFDHNALFTASLGPARCIIRPIHMAKRLSIPKAVAPLADEFNAYDQSPYLVTDARWHKAVHSDDCGFNVRFVQCHERRAAMMIDHRADDGKVEHGEATGQAPGARAVWDMLYWIDGHGIVPLVRLIADLLAPLRSTAAADMFEGLASLASMTLFLSCWGRGQQYLTLIRWQDGFLPEQGATP
jgi:hypothetical protein